MSFARIAAEFFLRCTEVVSPRSKKEWARGMHAEFFVLENDAAALSWSVGCLTTAAGLRLRSEAIYVLALVAIAVFWEQIRELGLWLAGGPTWADLRDEATTHGDRDMLLMMAAVSQGKSVVIRPLLLGLLAFALTLHRPRRAILTAFIVPLATWELPMAVSNFQNTTLGMLISGGLQLDGAAWFTLYDIWPGIVGALIAWVVARQWILRTISPTSSGQSAG